MLVQLIADRSQRGGRDLGAGRYIGAIHGSVGQKAGAQIIEHIEMSGLTVWRRMIWQRGQVVGYRLHAIMGRICALTPSLVDLVFFRGGACWVVVRVMCCARRGVHV